MRIAAALLLAAPALAGDPAPRFAPENLPAHVYDGGWEHFVGGGVAAFDCDTDGLPELYAAGGANPATLLRNRTPRPGAPLRFEAAPPPDPDFATGVTGAWPLDVDGDGHADLAVLRVGANRLLRGLGDCRFEDATDAWGFHAGARWSTAFAATWEPGRDWPTLAVGAYVDRDDPDGPFEACDVNELHRPAGRGFAAPVALTPGYCALSMLFSDWARRGAADLRISNDRHYYVRGGAEQMWRLSPLRALGAADGWAGRMLWGMGVASRDLNGDGRPEAFSTSMGDQLLEFATDAPGYRAAPFGVGTYAQRPHAGGDGRPSTGWHAAFGDVDNDGLDDLFIAKGNVDQMPDSAMRDPNNLLMQRADGTFVERSAQAGVASMARGRGAALADLNGDGLLDLVVVNRRAPMELWRNVTPDPGGWVGVSLRDAGPNRDGVGAWLALRTPDGALRWREVTVGGGHGGGVLGPQHFGLGDAATAELRVTWPDGETTDWLPLTAGRVHRIRRGAAASP